jgi:TonB-linked SusC/RagA family outer membrane protein
VLRTFNSIRLNWNIWDNLNLSEKITYDNTNGEEDVLWDRESNNGSPSGVFQRIKNTNEQINTQTQLTYNKKFGLHGLDVLLGFETEDSKYSYNYMSGQDYPGDLYELGNAGTTSAESQKYRAKMVSYLGRVNYTYNDLYYLSASFRRDGSSRFAKDSRWGNFWSVSGSWRFTGEKFFDNLKNVLSDGRLRISYGTNGTLPTNYYGYMSIYKYGEYYNGESGMGIVGVGNPDLKWEKNKAFNIGLDLTFLNKYTATFDWYNRTTSDLIYNMPISAVPGYYDSSYNATTPMNIGSLRNTGWELTLNANWYNKKDFSWSTSVNIAHNHNKVIKLNGSTDVIMDNTYSRVLAHKVGETYNSYYAYEYAGVDPETGNELYYINDGSENARNTTTDATKAQKVIIGSAEASIEGGISNTIKYKDFDFNMNFTYQIGGDAYDYPRWQHSNGGDALYQGAVPSYYDLSKMWTGPGDTSCSLPKFQYGSSFVYSSRWMMPLDYLRLKSLSLGYSLPRELVSRLSLSKARVYFSASNLFTIKSSDLYVDPEVPTNGIANFETPAMRTFTFGIELGF